MNDLIQMEMSLEEARETDRLIKRHINTTRYLLLDMRDRKGWKALGYESFVEYGEKELGFQKSHIYDLTNAAEIGLQIGFSDKSENQPKERHLHPLKQVPEEERKAIWEEATRKAEEEQAKLTAQRVQEAVAEWKQRSQESLNESNERRKTIQELETQIDLLKSQPAPKPQVVEKAPDDYEAAKKQAAELQMQTQALQKQLETLQKQQDKIINDQVKTKLQERETELNDMEQRKRFMEQEVERLKNYMASLDSDAKRNEVHQSVIEEQRLQLISLAAFLTDADPIRDSDTIKKWRALAAMHRDAAHGIDAVFGKPHLELAA